MTDDDIERKVQEAELLLEAGYEDFKRGVMTREQLAIHSAWVYNVLMRDCPDDVVRAVAEYEVFIISETA